MLVLGRKENQSIIIGDNIRITIVGRSGSSIRIGVEAPSDVRVMREELVPRDSCIEQPVAAPSFSNTAAGALLQHQTSLDGGLLEVITAVSGL